MSQEDRKSQVPQLRPTIFQRPTAAKYIKYFKKKKKGWENQKGLKLVQGVWVGKAKKAILYWRPEVNNSSQNFLITKKSL